MWILSFPTYSEFLLLRFACYWKIVTPVIIPGRGLREKAPEQRARHSNTWACVISPTAIHPGIPEMPDTLTRNNWSQSFSKCVLGEWVWPLSPLSCPDVCVHCFKCELLNHAAPVSRRSSGSVTLIFEGETVLKRKRSYTINFPLQEIAAQTWRSLPRLGLWFAL